ncbi:LuxR C-terminal-related transcriptional regulator [Micromonospora sp. WMMD1102]|uniref:LuxR C-terminal-related transcriptional regulator n=1 Tax=Micromonospora sp. WMMD1102 TaxID=3016105 RepID=UPI002415917F|nr:LuxR C-terminal-related transcriptional regulator [Micromonospora sp. WMMD1102]MDG4789066.1 LuxR C-terminal-related transcriptional regulator [Micromonospora sp. WMMD1102]
MERIEEPAGGNTPATAGSGTAAPAIAEPGSATPPLLTAKLAATPRSGAVLLPRPRLFELLDRGTAGPLTLVSASAGWGKTVLLSSWCRARNATVGRAVDSPDRGPVGWLSLEPGDGGARLWSYLYAALRPAVDGQQPDAGDEPDPAYGLEFLADQLARRTGPATLILDDLHQVDDPEVSSGLEFLLRHTAGRLRLVIGCRTDPGLALHRWRLSGELTEIRAADLAFRPDEVAELFSGYGEPLPPEQARRLCGRTEGWPAGLRFATLALPGHPDPARFVDEFTGEYPDVGDYLTEELLSGLSADARESLCRASLVAGFSAELLGALTGRADAARTLSELDRLGGFVIPLGGRPAGYRCHPMLGELLRSELARRPAEQVAELHRRAATWFTANDLPAEALRHALAARDWPYAINVLLRHWPDIVPYGQYAPARPEPPAPSVEVVRNAPEIGLAYAADRLDGGESTAADDYLTLAAEHADRLDAARRHRFRRIAAALRLAAAQSGGDEPAVLAGFTDLLAPDPPDTRAHTNRQSRPSAQGRRDSRSQRDPSSRLETSSRRDPSSRPDTAGRAGAGQGGGAGIEATVDGGTLLGFDLDTYVDADRIDLTRLTLLDVDRSGPDGSGWSGPDGSAPLGAGLADPPARQLAVDPVDGGETDLGGLDLRAGAVARILSGTIRFGAGDIVAAEPEIADGLAEASRAGLSRARRLCLGRLALARAVRGELTGADETARAALGSAPFRGLIRPADGVHAYLAQALVALHRDRPDDAAANLALGIRGAEYVDDPLVHALTGLVEARLLRDRGDLTGAHQVLAGIRRRLGDRAETQPLAHWLLAAEAELRIDHGDVELARELLTPAVERGAAPVEPVAVALARAHLRAGDPQAALRTLPAWETPPGAPPGAPGEPLPPPLLPPLPLPPPLSLRLVAGLLDASAARLSGDHRRAARVLEQVLRLAEPEGFRQVFVRADPPVRDLLAAHLDSGTAYWAMVHELVGAVDGAAGTVPTGPAVPPGEPLTERELTVLRYLQSILSNVEIAAELSLSVNTVKTHVRNVYRKLDVTRRRDAVRRARELNLI